MNETNRTDTESSSSTTQPQQVKISMTEGIENLLADLLGVLVRWANTVYLVAVRPTKAAQEMIPHSVDYAKVSRPYTFLLVGCLLYSFLLGALVDTSLSSSNLPDYVSQVAIETTREFSFTALLIRSLPLIVVMSLFAAIVDRIVGVPDASVRTLMVYQYGAQGAILFLFILTLPWLADVFIAWLGGDDYILLVFAALVIGLTIQGYRALRQLVRLTLNGQGLRLWQSVIFPPLFLLPLPLAGFLVLSMGLIGGDIEVAPK